MLCVMSQDIGNRRQRGGVAGRHYLAITATADRQLAAYDRETGDATVVARQFVCGRSARRPTTLR